MTDRRLTRLAYVLGVLGLLTLATTLTPLWNRIATAMQSAAQIGPADAIVVLGSNAYADGTLNSGSLRRAIHGITLLHAGHAPRIVFTGAPVTRTLSEALLRQRLARALRVPEEAILIDERPLTTREEAKYVAERLRPLGATKILLVTGGGHMARARRQFEQQGLTVLAAPVREAPFASTTAGDRLELARIVLAELASHLYYKLAGYL
jgi:uncharacterized SAM-binding protein YcdF (DUF218 family)